ncbi:MAG TPA: hypothetical protein VK165_20310 [Azonexus sp.]|nr:hypothetical protein [Azonexus sp.]
MSDTKHLPRWIPIAGAVSTLSVPFLYIFGYAYDQGYLHVFGIGNDFFARSPQEYLVLAFFACLGIATLTINFISQNEMLFLVIAITFGVIGWCYVFANKHKFGDRLRRKVAPLKDHQWFDYFFFPLISASLSYVAPVTLVVSIFLILFIPAVSYFKGASDAQRDIDKATQCQYSKAPTEGCVALIENGEPVALGMFVARSQSHLALYANGKTSIFPVKDQLIEMVPISKLPNPAIHKTQPNKDAPHQ